MVPGEPDFVAKIERGEFDFTQPGVADIFAKVKYLTDNGLAHRAFMSTNNAQASSLFLQGRAATYFAGSWQASQLLGGDVDAGIFFPAVKDAGEATMGVLVPETGAGVSAASENRDAAIELLDWMFGDGYAFYQNGMGNIPSVHRGGRRGEARCARDPGARRGEGLSADPAVVPVPAVGDAAPWSPNCSTRFCSESLTPQEAAEELHHAARDAVMQ